MNTQTESQIEFTRINNDVNGNPRHVCHFPAFINANERGYTYDGESFDETKPILNLGVSEQYALALKKAKKIGGRKFHNKQYGGGIVFQEYGGSCLIQLQNLINEIKNK